jgi:hypothetical protein
MEALGWILITGAFCALSGALSWLFMPQYARSSLKATMYVAFGLGALIQSIIQWLVRS